MTTEHERIARLEELVYCPGMWRCPKCKFSMVCKSLNVGDGTVTANTDPQRCLNGCGPLWRVTERENRIEMQDGYEAAVSEIASLKALIAQAEARGPAWQPIETAPRDKTLFLVGSYYAPYDTALMRGDTLAMLTRPGAPRHLTPRAPYTHWMPMPSPPEAAKKESEV